MWFFKTAQLLLKLQKENDELRRGIGDILIILCNFSDKEEHHSIKNDNPTIGHIMKEIKLLKNKTKEGED